MWDYIVSLFSDVGPWFEELREAAQNFAEIVVTATPAFLGDTAQIFVTATPAGFAVAVSGGALLAVLASVLIFGGDWILRREK